MSVHVLDDADALTLLFALENRGVQIDLDGNDLLLEPRSALSDVDIIRIKEHKAALVRLFQICNERVQERVESFKQQMPSTAPVLIRGFRYVAGVCFSCGDRHRDRHRWGRCWRCALALRLVLNLTIEPAPLDTHGGPHAQSLASSDQPMDVLYPYEHTT